MFSPNRHTILMLMTDGRCSQISSEMTVDEINILMKFVKPIDTSITIDGKIFQCFYDLTQQIHEIGINNIATIIFNKEIRGNCMLTCQNNDLTTNVLHQLLHIRQRNIC